MSDEKSDGSGPGLASTRRLAAVLHADVVGYSRLMAKDEGGTHARLMSFRDILYEGLHTQNGRVVGTAGDAVLAVFDSVVDALSAALKIQEKLGQSNAELADDERLDFRIGLNIGDIIVDGDDIFGNGVNVAARVEALADPGGIAVSAAFKEQVGTRLDVTFEDRGLHAAKNIEAPLHVFAVYPPGSVLNRPKATRARRKLLAPMLAGLVAAALGLAFVLSGAFDTGSKSDPSTRESAEQDVSTALLKPTIVVLPFGSRGTEENDYFGDGVTEDVIGSLGRFSDLLVLSWSAVAPYKANPVEVTQLATDLGADYVVTGSIQRSDAKIRITVQLSDAANGVLIWSERYDEQLTDLLEVQDRLVRQVVAALAVRVTMREETRIATIPTESMTAYDLVLKGRKLFSEVARASNNGARELFEKALEEDPGYADALVALGKTHLHDLSFGWTFRPEYSLKTALDLANQAIERDPFNAGAFELLASVQKYTGDLEDAERSIDRSLDLNPNKAISHAEHCSILIFAGRPIEALQASELALRIDPYPRSDELNCPIMANLMLGEYEAALEYFDRFPDRTSEEPASLVARAGAHAMLGHSDEAEKHRAAALARYPFLRAESMSQIIGGQEYRQIVLKALQEAGFQ